MVRITIDEKLKEQLLATSGVVELVDESGKRLGRLIPEQPMDIDPQALFPELTEEEIQRRLNEPGPRLTTEEVKQLLRSRMKES